MTTPIVTSTRVGGRSNRKGHSGGCSCDRKVQQADISSVVGSLGRWWTLSTVVVFLRHGSDCLADRTNKQYFRTHIDFDVRLILYGARAISSLEAARSYASISIGYCVTRCPGDVRSTGPRFCVFPAEPSSEPRTNDRTVISYNSDTVTCNDQNR